MSYAYLLSFLFACNPDYNLLDPDRFNREEGPNGASVQGAHEDTTANGEQGTFEDNQQIDPDDIKPNMRIDAAIQHMGWGAQQTRCQIEIAFQRRHYEPREEEQDPNQGPPPERPEEAGQCIFNSRERPQGDPNGSGGGHHDNWFISGDLSGPEVLFTCILTPTSR